MTEKRWTSWIVGLGVAASLLAAVPASAQRTYATIRVGDPYKGTALEFSTAPRMVLIPDTRVYSIRENNFDNDLYRYDGQWYFVDNGNWYRADSWRGPFVNIRAADVPPDVWNVPTDYRTSWTARTDRTRYSDRTDYRDRTGTPGYPGYGDRGPMMRQGERYRGTSLMFQRQPRMGRIRGTRVQYIRNAFDNDLYRFGNRWYYVENGDWYQGSSWRGPFYYVSFDNVPYAVRSVPMDYRRAWADTNPRDYRRSYGNASYRIGERYNGNASFGLGPNSQPRMAIIPGTDVSYLIDDSDVDLYQYGNDWFLVDSGVWYRASSWQGPFFSISQSSVPRTVIRIPAGYRKTWASPTGY